MIWFWGHRDRIPRIVSRESKKKRKTGKHVKKANLTFCMGKRMYINFTSVSCMVFNLNKSKSHPWGQPLSYCVWSTNIFVPTPLYRTLPKPLLEDHECVCPRKYVCVRPISHAKTLNDQYEFVQFSVLESIFVAKEPHNFCSSSISLFKSKNEGGFFQPDLTSATVWTTVSSKI